MNGRRLKNAAWLLGFAIEASLLLFLSRDYTAPVWITLGFTAAAFLSLYLLWRKDTAAARDRFLNAPRAVVSAGWLLAQLVLCCVIARAEHSVGIKTAVFANLIVCLLAWLLVVATSAAKRQAKQVDLRQKDHHIQL